MLSRQRGLGLLEPLVAMALLAGALLALLAAQLDGFSLQRTSSHRADALRLVGDLAERIRAHSAGPPFAAGYLVDWDEVPAPVAPGCGIARCDEALLARAELAAWKVAVAEALPAGKAKVLASDTGDGDGDGAAGWLTVVLAWRPGGAALDRRPSGSADGADGEALSCPPGHVCHLGHVPL